MIKKAGEVEPIFQSGIETIRLIARSQHLPTSDEDLAALGEYLDAYDSKLVTDHALYLQAKTKARAYIALRLTERIRWDSGQGGAIGAMTAEFREKLLLKTKPKA